MGNADQVWAAILAAPGSSDSELVAITGITPHQQVNGICRRLVHTGRLERRPRADGRLGNFPAQAFTVAPATGQLVAHRAPEVPGPRPLANELPKAPRTPAQVGVNPLPPAHEAVILLPCSKAKVAGGTASLVGPPAPQALRPSTAKGLADARSALATRAALDERAVRPAIDRYSGFLYDACAPAVRAAASTGQPFVILSGGYGLLHPFEPVGTYERAFRPGDWPKGLLETALIEIVQGCRLTNVVAFCSQSTGYATLVRRTPWARYGIRSFLVMPEAPRGGGSQRQVPLAAGEALSSYLDGHLCPGWTSRSGLPVVVEVLQ